MQEDLRIYLTGTCRIERGDVVHEPRPLATDPARVIFAFLVCERGRHVAKIELRKALWSDAAPTDCDEVVKAAVQRVRRALSDAVSATALRTVGSGYELKLPTATWVDIEAASDALHDAEGLLRAGKVADAFGPSGIAHHIAKRPFLPGATGPWAEAQRERLRGIFVRALECRAEVFLANREFSTAADAATEAVKQEPLRETAHRLLMRAHAESGNTAAAVLAYDNCCKLLGGGLGVEPSLQTRTLYESIANGSSPTRVDRQAPPRAERATSLRPSDPGDARERIARAMGDAYTIEREIAGGMSRVFVAMERALARRVVIKVLPPELAAAVSTERFTREVRLAARLQQANIVPLLTAGDADGLPYYTMPFVAGESLRELLGTHGTSGLELRQAVSILRDVGRALAYAHREGVVHRDIKPENVLMSGETAVVTDFGIAKALKAAEHATDTNATAVTRTGISMGTPQYMAPEQAAGDPSVDHRADVYSYGILAYELLTGRTPFEGRTAGELLVAHFFEKPRDLAELRADVPPRLARLVMRCLEKNAEDRPQSMPEITEELS